MIAAVTLASTWDSAFLYTNDVFKKLTGQDCINIDSATIHNPLTLDSLKKAKIIYLGGGDQDRFMNLIKGTSVKQIIKQLSRNEIFKNVDFSRFSSGWFIRPGAGQ